MKPTVIQDGKYYIIFSTSSSRRHNDQQLKRMKQTGERIRNCGPLYFEVQKYLWSLPLMNKGKAMKLAQEISRLIHIHLDRQAIRQKESLICWYCENWIKVRFLIEPIYNFLRIQTPDSKLLNQVLNIESPAPAEDVDNFEFNVFEDDQINVF
ncbi:hypothetical protein TVAG_179650 [Trichomonas vaginalis G3]|uniref:Uncharacterized protein n=1 Tax=Trichomonas vaginalis (strain ATCC PRA-98 / G3) TaxID=412133 RepID=A2F447_TRIV3|nr:hypothetical protein TVAGG3_1002150 [Trichomonas vaginalis G3]EAY00294.1 hypothetical protein TVAG_179650 [Trichomonas vaginalis G3]KAI5490867.1 hypothetical protein TVAGG3_1002150 [Trichomonas vaginalis G3]|eukprot:XP_001313223.1 hypothetical protein [Trichomonas vaginalis G3]